MSEHKNQNDGLDLDKTIGKEVNRAETFVQRNKKVLSIVAGAVIVVVGGYVGFKQFVVKPQESEAQEALFIVQQQFERDSFSLVVNGNGNDLSAVDIADEYGMTKAGNLACYMAGVSYLRLGQYEDALLYLNDFSAGDDVIGPMAIGLRGDAHVELGEVEEGVKLYMKAANKGDNQFITPYFLNKAGIAYTHLGEHKKAEEVYTRIKTEYKDVPEWTDVEKYISRSSINTQE